MLTVLVVVWGLTPLTSALYTTFNNHMQPCPDLYPHLDADIDQLLGPWHLTLIAVDATEEDLVDSGVCVSGELLRHNKTVVTQLWTMQTTGDEEPVAMIELPTTVIRPGVWGVHTPLGGELKATVFDSEPQTYMLVSHCGLHRGSLVHLWTAAITRARVLSPRLRLHLISLLEAHGFHPLHSKVISWHGC